MQLRPGVLLLLLLFGSAVARAEALAPVAAAPGGCVSADVEVLADAGDLALFRIVFVNRCAAPRTLYWCADHPGAAVPALVSCPRAQGLPAEPRHAIAQRKEFQWHLPRGSRIRFQDCAVKDIPTSDFHCTAP